MISPLFLSSPNNSPEPVLITTNFVSIAAVAKTSPLTLFFHKTEPLSWSNKYTLPDESATTRAPKPAAIPEDKEFNFVCHLVFPEFDSIDLTFPSESAKKDALSAECW